MGLIVDARVLADPPLKFFANCFPNQLDLDPPPIGLMQLVNLINAGGFACLSDQAIQVVIPLGDSDEAAHLADPMGFPTNDQQA
jgi:hypothetical protein